VTDRLASYSAAKATAAPRPDLDARAKSVFGDRVIAPSATEPVIDGRGEW
jgi:hypothetical protein